MQMKTLVLALGLAGGAVLLSSCGDKAQEHTTNTASVQNEPSAAQPAEKSTVTEQAVEATKQAASAAQETATQAVEKVTDVAKSAATTVNEKVEQAKKAVAASMTPAVPAQPKPPTNKGAEIYEQCVGCHGPTGGGGVGPKLQGQAKEALIAKLKAYKAGQQRGPQTALMAPIAQGLSDEDIEKVANYIATHF